MAPFQLKLLEAAKQQSAQRLPIPRPPLTVGLGVQQPFGHHQLDSLKLQVADHPLPLTQTLPQIQLQSGILHPQLPRLATLLLQRQPVQGDGGSVVTPASPQSVQIALDRRIIDQPVEQLLPLLLQPGHPEARQADQQR